MNVWRQGTSWGKTPILEEMLRSKVGFRQEGGVGRREGMNHEYYTVFVYFVYFVV